MALAYLGRIIPAATGFSVAGALSATVARAQSTSFLTPIENFASSAIMFPVFMGAFAFVMWSATYIIRERRNLDQNYRELALEHADLKARHERAQALLDVPDQRIVIWAGREEAPICRGTLPASTGAPLDSSAFIAFGTWMTPQSAQSFEHAVERLRDRAEAFDLTVESRSGSLIDVQGRASGSHAFVRFVSLSGERAALASLETEHTRLIQTTDTMKALLESVPFPVWLRNTHGELTWANPPYLEALEADSVDEANTGDLQLLDAADRARLLESHNVARAEHAFSRFQERMTATVAGDRRMLDINEVAYDGGIAGMAIDMSELEELQIRFRRSREKQSQMLNQLSTAVALFDENRRLAFANDAFDDLWGLKPGTLPEEVDNGRLFDILREKGKLAEQPVFSTWRDELLRVYQSTQHQEHWWHLPDGRTLHVIANPHREGGVTWVFENITKQLEMESRFITLTQVQGETLDHLGEAIAVFAPNGHLKLSNPSFQKLWQLDDEQVAAETKIAAIADLCRPNVDPSPEYRDIWDELVTGVTGFMEHRRTVSGRLLQKSGAIVDYALVPLPNGQTMLSFADVSASVTLEKTLKERNEALEAAEDLKKALIERVSYDFRAPLTNIKGFAEALQQGLFGTLNEKQLEYVGHITNSSSVLHALVDNLLDLATVDAGIMELDLQTIDAKKTAAHAARSVAELLTERGINLSIKHQGAKMGGDFVADPVRVQQVLFNLLTNAISFSKERSSIELISKVSADDVSFRISDTGPGVPEESREHIFERFRGNDREGNRRGAGLGLAIARSLVELHGGRIELDTTVEEGASFVCHFPRRPKQEENPTAVAAE